LSIRCYTIQMWPICGEFLESQGLWLDPLCGICHCDIGNTTCPTAIELTGRDMCWSSRRVHRQSSTARLYLAGNLPAIKWDVTTVNRSIMHGKGGEWSWEPFCLRHHSSDSGRRDVANDFGKRLPEIAFQNPNANMTFLRVRDSDSTSSRKRGQVAGHVHARNASVALKVSRHHPTTTQLSINNVSQNEAQD